MLNLQKALRQKVIEEGRSKPFLISIGDRAEAITAAYENRQTATQDVLAALIEVTEEYLQADQEREQMDLDENTFAIYRVLKNAVEVITPEQARGVDQVFAQYPNYQWDAHEEKELRATLYRTLVPTVGMDNIENLIETTNTLLRLERI